MLRQTWPSLVFLCNPNNPTGAICPLRATEHWTTVCHETLFIIDEAYLAFASCPSALEINAPNLLVLRSMTKDYALAGLRLGYAAGPVELIEAISGLRPAWNVNAPAQAAGVAALSDPDHLRDGLARLRAAKDALVHGLQALGLSPVPSAVHYFLLQVGDGATTRRRLLDHGILVRDCASFGLPAYIRIATRRPQENERLLRALREVLPCPG
jgi:histidinol-phosphate aminotransferase